MIPRFIKDRVRKYDICWGFKIWSFGSRLLELWYIPANYEIIPHSHPNEHITLVPLYGSVRAFRRDGEKAKAEEVKTKLGGRYKIPAGWIHWFIPTNSKPFIFLNFSTWKSGVVPTSAAQDFKTYARQS
jgi:hypothetical protein